MKKNFDREIVTFKSRAEPDQTKLFDNIFFFFLDLNIPCGQAFKAAVTTEHQV